MGAAADASGVYRKEMGSHEFASRRGLDAVEQGASYAAGIAATAGVVTGLKSVAAGGGVLAGTAATAAGSGVVLPLAVAAVAGSAVVYSLRPIRRRAEAWAVERSKRKRMNSEAAAAPDVEASDPKE